MKTLTIETTGAIEFNFNGSCRNTDLVDPNFSLWAIGEFNQIIGLLEADGCNYVHFEDTGYRTLFHKRRMGEVEIWDAPIPDIFTNLETLLSEYEAAEQAALESVAVAPASPEVLPADGN